MYIPPTPTQAPRMYCTFTKSCQRHFCSRVQVNKVHPHFLICFFPLLKRSQKKKNIMWPFILILQAPEFRKCDGERKKHMKKKNTWC